ncbi:hypothetical protein FB45DRAFT_863232 [Roridomyces roridus]|uniref:Uncharacterized protein n=1 Tax=Roridomyces roridus TaxID=1738132 RepID=A0AAD7C8Y7_9AGAR|nr:hypothetical protein FB45DRAFT_863232 [Roridomyces roridus]
MAIVSCVSVPWMQTTIQFKTTLSRMKCLFHESVIMTHERARPAGSTTVTTKSGTAETSRAAVAVAVALRVGIGTGVNSSEFAKANSICAQKNPLAPSLHQVAVISVPNPRVTRTRTRGYGYTATTGTASLGYPDPLTQNETARGNLGSTRLGLGLSGFVFYEVSSTNLAEVDQGLSGLA